MKNQLVILGGMGPQASLKLHELLLSVSRMYHDGAPDSYPAILHISLQVPDFIGSIERYNEALTLIKNTCKELPLASSSAIGIACNTAHLMEKDLPLENVPFVSMIQAVVDEAKAVGSRKIGLLASPNTIKSGLYDDAFAKTNMTIVHLDTSGINKLEEIIHRVINGEDPGLLRPELNLLAGQLVDAGADTILLGCTELPLVGLNKDLSVIDSLDALARAMLRKHYGINKLR